MSQTDLSYLTVMISQTPTGVPRCDEQERPNAVAWCCGQVGRWQQTENEQPVFLIVALLVLISSFLFLPFVLVTAFLVFVDETLQRSHLLPASHPTKTSLLPLLGHLLLVPPLLHLGLFHHPLAPTRPLLLTGAGPALSTLGDAAWRCWSPQSSTLQLFSPLHGKPRNAGDQTMRNIFVTKFHLLFCSSAAVYSLKKTKYKKERRMWIRRLRTWNF